MKNCDFPLSVGVFKDFGLVYLCLVPSWSVKGLMISNLKFKSDFVVDFETVGLLWLTLVASTRPRMQNGSSDTTQL